MSFKEQYLTEIGDDEEEYLRYEHFLLGFSISKNLDPVEHVEAGGNYGGRGDMLFNLGVYERIAGIPEWAAVAADKVRYTICDEFGWCEIRESTPRDKLAITLLDVMVSVGLGFPVPSALIADYIIRHEILDRVCDCRR